jgi:pyrroline-5-carboxylate reductase
VHLAAFGASVRWARTAISIRAPVISPGGTTAAVATAVSVGRARPIVALSVVAWGGKRHLSGGLSLGSGAAEG